MKDDARISEIQAGGLKKGKFENQEPDRQRVERKLCWPNINMA